MSTIHPFPIMYAIEEAINGTGWGLYNKFIIAFAAISYVSNAMAFMAVPLYIPTIRCDIKFKETSFNAIHILLLTGMAFGGFFFSAVSDVVGRRSILTLSLILIFISLLSGSFAYGPAMLMISNFVLGTGLATNLEVIKIYVAEINPMKYRGRYSIFIDVFWTVGCAIAIGISVASRPIVAQYKHHSARVFTWRLLYCLAGLISFILSCMTSLLLQSPRYLLFEKRTGEALTIMREIYAINKSKVCSNYTIAEVDLQGKIESYGINAERDIPNNLSSRRCMIIFRRIHKAMLLLVQRKFFGYTILVIAMRLFTSFGLFTLNLILAKTLLYDNDAYLNSMNLLHFEHPFLTDCNDTAIDVKLYRDYLILSGVSVLGQLIYMPCVPYIDLKYLIFVGFLIAAISAILLVYVGYNYIIRFVLSSFMIFGYAAAESSLNFMVIHIFPTAIRCTAFGETFVLSRVAFILMIQYIDINFKWLFISIGIMFGGAALLSFAFPKCKHLPIAA